MLVELWITTKVVGYHHWPDAPAEVAFLRHPHRHVFHIKVGLSPSHDDRAYEFFIEQRKLNQLLHKDADGEINFTTFSCEQIAKSLMSKDLRYFYVEVSEDGENGAVVYSEVV